MSFKTIATITAIIALMLAVGYLFFGARSHCALAAAIHR